MRVIFLLVCTSVFFHVQTCHAIAPVRCAGKIQYRPCEYAEDQGTRARLKTSAARGKNSVNAHSTLVKGSRYVKVLSHKFKKLSAKEGLWDGWVEGNGNIELSLKILRNGVHEATRYMGTVVLLNQKSSFAYHSYLPSGNGWSWEIVGKAS